jgi:hypothetical protein
MKLTYWVCDCFEYRRCYALRARTRWEVQQLRIDQGAEHYDEPRKIVVEYTNAFNLVEQALGEGGVE